MKKKSEKKEEVVVGLPYYTPEEYSSLKGCMDDDDNFGTYTDWVRTRKNLKYLLEGKKMKVVNIQMNVHKLKKWLSEQGLPNTSESRSKYIAEQVRLLSRKKK
jgi:hypothetical protein